MGSEMCIRDRYRDSQHNASTDSFHGIGRGLPIEIDIQTNKRMLGVNSISLVINEIFVTFQVMLVGHFTLKIERLPAS